MAGGKKQVTGYKYYTTLVSVLGNCIEGIIAVNYGAKGWVYNDDGQVMKAGPYTINCPHIFGETEGGVAGRFDIYDGSQVNADEYYQQHYALAPAYKGRSFVIFKDFYIGNSPFLKEIQFWPQRIHVKNDGSPQWYDEKAGIAELQKVGNDELLLVEGFHYFNRTIYEQYPPLAGHTTTINDNKAQYLGNGDRKNGVFQYFGNLAAGGSYDADKESTHGSPYKTYFEVSGVNLVGIASSEYIVKYKAKNHTAKWTVLGGNSILFLARIATYIDDDGFTCDKYRIVIDLSLCTYFKFELTAAGGVYFSEDSNTVSIATAIIFNVTPSLVFSKSDSYDINPIHKIRELLTDKTAMNKPESDINNANFMACADRIFNESLGISWAIQEKSCVDALNEICTHIEAGVRVNRQTGLYEVVLFRDDLNSTENALSFNESNIKSLQFDIQNSDEMINTLNVSYYDRENIKKSTFNVYENGLIRTVGYEQSENIDFPYFMNKRNAEIVANWKLKQFSTQAFKGSFTTGLYEARKLNRFDIVLLSWSNRRISNMPVRVTGINLGDGVNNTVTIDFTEIVAYSNMMQANINTDNSNNSILPPQENESIVLEVPYYEAVQVYGEVDVNAQLDNAPEMGYLMAATKRPQNNSLSAQLHTTAGAEWERVGTVHYAPSCNISNELGYLDATVLVDNMSGFTELLADTIGQINNELIAFVSFDSYTNTLTIKRGVLDTIPQKHNAGDSIYFWDNSNGVDSTPYMMGEVINAKVLTTTPSGIQDFDTAPLLTLNMNARAIRPYPPANIKLNNVYYPQSLLATGNLLIEWSDRNRKQQTGGALLKWTDSSVTLESDVTYNIEVYSEGGLIYSAYDINGTQHTILANTLNPNKSNILKVWSKRDGFNNYQTFEHAFFVESASLLLTATVSKDKVIGNTVPTAGISVNVDESLAANMLADGSEIKGKAEAGAIITIEVED